MHACMHVPIVYTYLFVVILFNFRSVSFQLAGTSCKSHPPKIMKLLEQKLLLKECGFSEICV
jgi:hypothetical protein